MNSFVSSFSDNLNADPDDLFNASFDFQSWCLCLPRWIFATRTHFSWTLLRSFQAKRQGSSLSTAAFPWPSPSLEVFAVCSGPGLSAKKLKKLARARAQHVIVFVLNFLYLGRFPSCAEIGKPPNESQLSVFARIRSVAVCGSDPGKFPLAPGRSGPELVSCIMQLESFIKGCPGFTDAYSPVPRAPFFEDDGLFPADQYPQLVPHRELDASRLRLSGEGKWPMEKYLRNCLWLPFQEPAFLCHGLSLESACVPIASSMNRGMSASNLRDFGIAVVCCPCLVLLWPPVISTSVQEPRV